MSDRKAIRVRFWKGDKKQYNPWSEKVLAKAEYKDYHKMMLYKRERYGFDVVPIEADVRATEVEVSKTAMDKKYFEAGQTQQASLHGVIIEYWYNNE